MIFIALFNGFIIEFLLLYVWRRNCRAMTQQWVFSQLKQRHNWDEQLRTIADSMFILFNLFKKLIGNSLRKTIDTAVLIDMNSLVFQYMQWIVGFILIIQRIQLTAVFDKYKFNRQLNKVSILLSLSLAEIAKKSSITNRHSKLKMLHKYHTVSLNTIKVQFFQYSNYLINKMCVFNALHFNCIALQVNRGTVSPKPPLNILIKPPWETPFCRL